MSEARDAGAPGDSGQNPIGSVLPDYEVTPEQREIIDACLKHGHSEMVTWSRSNDYGVGEHAMRQKGVQR